MTAKQLFTKTMPFVWVKLMLGGAMVLISAILLGIIMGLGWLFGEEAMVIAFGIWAAAVGGLRFIMMHYMGYLVKAGHIAVIAEACATGQIPPNQVNYGKEIVQQRFVTSNAFFAVDSLVTAAVKQIQKGIGKIGDVLDFIPGMDAMTGAVQFFVSIALGYIDECCLGWTFYNKQQNAFKSAADGVVIYAQNWKPLLKSAAMTLLKTLLGIVIFTLLIFVPIGLIFKLFKWSGFLAFVIACLIAWVVKFAIMDSYIMIQMMASYMAVAPQTTLAFDLYTNLAGMSKSFKELWDKGVAEMQGAQPVYAAADTANAPLAAPVTNNQAAPMANTQTTAAKPVFCGQCGTKNEPGTRFCGNCGAKM